jgi:hypothetical protein
MHAFGFKNFMYTYMYTLCMYTHTHRHTNNGKKKLASKTNIHAHDRESQKARKMARGEDGVWNHTMYIPEKAEFMYQYLLIKEDSDSDTPIVVWEGGIERKCKLNDAVRYA